MIVIYPCIMYVMGRNLILQPFKYCIKTRHLIQHEFFVLLHALLLEAIYEIGTVAIQPCTMLDHSFIKIELARHHVYATLSNGAWILITIGDSSN